MKRIIFLILFVMAITTSLYADDKIKVVATYPYIESIVKEIGRDAVEVSTLAKGTEDPHFVVPKPSLIGRLRQADLLIINGASLEIGFLPPLLKQANNPKINAGSEYLIDLSKRVELIQKPESVSRSEGDIHPEGNPHYYLSYRNFPLIASAVKEALIKVRPERREFFEKNYNDLMEKFEAKRKVWDEKLKIINGCKLIQYHRMFDYVARDANCTMFAEIEPKPGIPPTAKHIEEIIEKSKSEKIHKIISDDYHETKSVKRISEAIKIPFVLLPHDVRSFNHIKDIFDMYNYIVEELVR